MKPGKKHLRKKNYPKKALKKREKSSVDANRINLEIEIAIFEVDKIFEGQGDKLDDGYITESLASFIKLVEENSFVLLAEDLHEGVDDESDMLHINLVNRINSLYEELDAEIDDSFIVEALKRLLSKVKKYKSAKNSRAYLDALTKKMKEMGYKSEFYTESDTNDNTLSLDEIDDIDDLTSDDDEFDLDDFRPEP
ncbi:MAG: hypothetical protein ACP5US_00120 [Candidatus Kryptoniota bacterium]